ncbi:hypothetical protein LSAT2_014758 [Lamellibrachia satsuma]|nr:hypothetical protein LSAT2_014758 [Lamellibrachia satsuma]
MLTHTVCVEDINNTGDVVYGRVYVVSYDDTPGYNTSATSHMPPPAPLHVAPFSQIWRYWAEATCTESRRVGETVIIIHQCPCFDKSKVCRVGHAPKRVARPCNAKVAITQCYSSALFVPLDVRCPRDVSSCQQPLLTGGSARGQEALLE